MLCEGIYSRLQILSIRLDTHPLLYETLYCSVAPCVEEATGIPELRNIDDGDSIDKYILRAFYKSRNDINTILPNFHNRVAKLF